MPDPGKAVFLSYASQDAEAAKRIADALRSSGVEVWFDAEGGLEHGDEWDAKIRRQIKECVLFLPIISANTQAREEGYFRLEWDLATERARTIASGVAFILPIVIDDTKEPDALVPDRFRTVQWTRLRGGEVTPEVKARFLKLWSHRAGVVKQQGREQEAGVGGALRPDSSEPSGPKAPSAPIHRLRWVVPVCLLLAAVGAWFALRPGSPAAPASNPTPGTSNLTSASPASEAGQLIERAWAIFEKVDDASNDEWDLAEGMTTQATKLEPRNAEAWAVHASVTIMPHVFGHDSSPARLGRATKAAQLAVNLDPQSVDARAALANCYRLGDASLQAEAMRIIRALAIEQPRNKRVQRIAGNVLRTSLKFDEAIAAFDRAMALPGGDPYSRFGKERALRLTGRFAEGEALVDEALARNPGPAALMRKLYYVSVVHDDLDRAAELLLQVPTQFLLREQGANQAISIWLWRRDADRCIAVLRQYPGETVFGTLKGAYVGLAYSISGRAEAARLEWQSVLKQVEARLAAQPNDPVMLYHKAILQASLNDRVAGEAAWKAVEELAPAKGSNDHYSKAFVLAGLGRPDEAIAALETSLERADNAMVLMELRMGLRHDPFLDPLRTLPRFRALLEKFDRMQIGTAAGTAAGTTDQRPETRDRGSRTTNVAADAQSVAVLAFANLSDDKSNEYFSDGISEELLNVLAKVPGLKVSARTSAFYFKNKDVPIPEIAQKLGVAYVVEGSVRKQGEKVRITAQLIKAADGFHVWSDTFTRDLKDIFAVQDEIAGLIAQQLQLKLGASTRAAKVVNPEAHRLVLEGRHFWLLRTNEGFARAESAYRRALEIDPEFAEAHAGLANVCVVRGWYENLEGNEVEADFSRAREFAQRALALDPQMADPWAALGALEFNQWRFAESEQAFQTALRLNPNYSYGHHWRSHLLMAQGRLDESLVELERAVQLDPMSLSTLVIYTLHLQFAGRYPEALAVADRTQAFTPYFFTPLQASRAFSLLKVGRKDEALAVAREVARDVTLKPRWWNDALVIAVLRDTGHAAEAQDFARRLFAAMPASSRARPPLLVALGQPEQALDAMASIRPGASAFGYFFYHDDAESLRQSPRWREFLAKHGEMADYERARATLARMQRERGEKP